MTKSLTISVVVALLYFLFGLLSFYAVVANKIVTPVFFVPEALSLAATLYFGLKSLPGILVGQFVLAFSRGLALMPALAISTSNSLEVLLGLILFRKLNARTEMSRVKDLLSLLGLVLFVLQPLSATLGNLILYFSGVILTVPEISNSWLNWWSGNSLAQTMLVPFCLACLHSTQSVIDHLKKALLPSLFLGLVTWYTFSHYADKGVALSLVLYLPFLLWLADRGKLPYVSLVSSLIAIYGLFMTSRGQGIFVYDGNLHFLDLNVFLLGLSISTELVSMAASEREAIIREVTLRRDEALKELNTAYCIYQNSIEGMMVCDSQNQITSVNPSFTQISGYTAEEVIGKNPKILGSGQHNASFFQVMWDTLSATGQWQGEMTNRHKQGHEYVEWLTIKTIYSPEGALEGFIGLFSDISEKKETEAIILRYANYDLLTDLPNRRLFADRVEQAIIKVKRTQSLFALLFIDLDRFKEVNDSMGHYVGDLLLVETAGRIKSCLRGSDTLARLGGDEFIIILTDISERSNASKVAQNILNALIAPYFLNNQQLNISCSIGITFFPDDGLSVSDLMKNADQAMYAAKHRGRNCFEFFHYEMQESTNLRMRLAQDLRKALVSHQFEVYLQPIVALDTNRVTKAEALVRWNHPEHGLVSPGIFIPLAEEIGVIHELGDWVFQQALALTSEFVSIMGEHFQISVNKSPIQLLDIKGDSHKRWDRQILDMNANGKSIVIEITEGIFIPDNIHLLEKLQSFRNIGMQIAIDDFGTGYSSLSYLKKLNIDYLKIDQSFVRNLEQDNEDLILCEAIIVMAHKLGLLVIAEGIETKEQLNLLSQINCDYGQGFIIAKPMSVKDFKDYLVRVLSLA